MIRQRLKIIFHFKNIRDFTCTSILLTTLATLTTLLYINILYHYCYILRVVKSSKQ